MVYDFFEELKDIIKEKIKDIYMKSKYFILILIFLLLVGCIFLCKKEEPSAIESQQLKLFDITIENWAQWITLIALPYTAGWAIFQFKKSNYAKKQEKAVEIEREFSKSLIHKCGIINTVYTNSPLNDYLKFDEKNYDDFKFFNVDELRQIYNDDNFPSEYDKKSSELALELDEIYHSILLNHVTSYASTNEKTLKVNLNLKNNSIESIEEIKKESDNTLQNPFILQNKDYPYHFYELVSDVLNQLEYICMDISSKATDSNFIYQSLHQMFLRTVRTLAVEISIDNNNFSDKYYTNIIHVYNSWTTRYIKDLKIEKRKKEKINKILNPKIKTV